jgi:hypothetical protein
MKLVCRNCQEEKETSCFYKHPTCVSGFSAICKPCHKDRMKVRQESKASEISEYHKAYRKEKAEELFSKRKEYRQSNAETIAERKRAAYLSDIDRQRESRKEWQRNNPEKVAARNARWKKANPDKVLASTIKRLSHIQRATPSWANEFFIAEAYHLAKVREKVLGGKWHVDHVIPLRGKTVCGLHVENNLQVIPATMNLRKGNRLQSAIL